MAPKNIDETIKKLLTGYAQWCYTVLQKEHKRLQKQYFPTQKDRSDAIQEHTKAKHAYEFLLKIAQEPKKYLYSGKDLVYADGDLYNKLDPILDMPYDKTGNNLLVRLGEKIAHHVKHGKDNNDGVWLYYGNSLVFDLDAEEIIKINKVVQLWNANNFIAAIKDFAPASVFAVDAYKNER
jgi:hypothetical protein